MTSLAISSLPRSEAQIMDLDELTEEIFFRVNGLMNRDLNKAKIILGTSIKDAFLVCVILFGVLIR